MDTKFDDDFVKSQLLNINCWQIKISYPYILTLYFGNKVEYSIPKYGKKYKGEWTIYSEYCDW